MTTEKTVRKTVRLSGDYAGEERAVLNALYRGLDAPWWASLNLDAAWDLLTTEVPGPIEITWAEHSGLKRVVALLTDAAEERDDLTVLFTNGQGAKSV